jgi:hypothetical protein
MSKNKERAPRLNDANNFLAEVRVALEDLVREGLVYDSGERRKGQIVWKSTPLGLKVAEEEEAQELLANQQTGTRSGAKGV